MLAIFKSLGVYHRIPLYARKELSREEDSARSLINSRCFSAHIRSDEDEQELKKVEEEWANAYVRHDVAPLDRILADEFITVGSNGKSHGKAEDIEGLKSDSATYEYSTAYDLDIRFYGNTVVAVGRPKEKGHYPSGRQFVNEYRWTDVFVKRQGRWQCVAAQVVSLPPTKAE